MEFQHLTIAGKQYDNHIVCLTENLLFALKKSRGIMVSFGDKVMVYAGNLKELCQIYPKHRIEFDVMDGKVAFAIDDDGVKVKGSFNGWSMAQTVAIHRGKKVHINEIVVLSWSYVHRPLPAPTMPVEQPDPVIPSLPVPQRSKRHVWHVLSRLKCPFASP